MMLHVHTDCGIGYARVLCTPIKGNRMGAGYSVYPRAVAASSAQALRHSAPNNSSVIRARSCGSELWAGCAQRESSQRPEPVG